jgi:hypothetical protein
MSPNGPKWDSTWPMSPWSSIRCVQNDFSAYCMFSTNSAPLLWHSYHYLQMDRNVLPLEPRYLGVTSGAFKTISEPMVLLAQPCTYHALTLTLSPNGPNWASTLVSSPRTTIGLSKMIFEPTVQLAQRVHMSCTDTNTVSRRTKMRFHITHVTKEFHRVHPKSFLSLWYVRRKPCTYLAPILTLYSNRPKRDSTWLTSPWSTIGCIQNYFRVNGLFSANHAPILRQDYHYLQMDQNEFPLEHRHLVVPSVCSKQFLSQWYFWRNRAPILHWHKHCLQTDQNELSLEPHHLGVPSGSSKLISEPMVRLAQTVHLPCTVTNTVSK